MTTATKCEACGAIMGRTATKCQQCGEESKAARRAGKVAGVFVLVWIVGWLLAVAAIGTCVVVILL